MLYKTTGFAYTLFRQSIKQANDNIEVRVDLELCSNCMLSWLDSYRGIMKSPPALLGIGISHLLNNWYLLQLVVSSLKLNQHHVMDKSPGTIVPREIFEASSSWTGLQPCRKGNVVDAYHDCTAGSCVEIIESACSLIWGT